MCALKPLPDGRRGLCACCCTLQGKGIWEFKLDEDSNGQECTCFGLAIKPVTRSNYDGSRELWMYRYVSGMYGVVAVSVPWVPARRRDSYVVVVVAATQGVQRSDLPAWRVWLSVCEGMRLVV